MQKAATTAGRPHSDGLIQAHVTPCTEHFGRGHRKNMMYFASQGVKNNISHLQFAPFTLLVQINIYLSTVQHLCYQGVGLENLA